MSFQLTPKRHRIELGDEGHLELRGLSATDIQAIIRDGYVHLAPLVERFAASSADNAPIDAEFDGELIRAVLIRTPEFLAHAIALAADVPDEVDSVRQLPLDVQLAAIEAIGRMTFTQGGVEGFLNTLKVIAGVSRNMQHSARTADAQPTARSLR